MNSEADTMNFSIFPRDARLTRVEKDRHHIDTLIASPNLIAIQRTAEDPYQETPSKDPGPRPNHRNA